MTISLNPPLHRLYTRQDWAAAPDKHRVLHVILRHGENGGENGERETYALDLSGVQFGLVNPVVPWAEYLETHVREVLKVEV